MKSIVRASVAGAMLWASVTCAEAQGPRARALDRVGQEQPIRLYTRGSGILEGTLGCSDSVVAFVRIGGVDRLLDVGAMDSIWGYRRRFESGGATRGTMLGMVAGALVATRIPHLEQRRGMVLGVATIVAFGALGRFIGSRRSHDAGTRQLLFSTP